jgi:hypothetical protein
MAKRDGNYDGLGHVNPARSSAQMAAEREPLLSGPVPHCTVPGCLRDVRADGLCIEHLEVREISRPYGLDHARLRLAEGCDCLEDRATGELVRPCAAHDRWQEGLHTSEAGAD